MLFFRFGSLVFFFFLVLSFSAIFHLFLFDLFLFLLEKPLRQKKPDFLPHAVLSGSPAENFRNKNDDPFLMVSFRL